MEYVSPWGGYCRNRLPQESWRNGSSASGCRVSAPATLYQIEDELLAALDTIEMVGTDDSALKAELEEHIARLIAAEITKVDGVVRVCTPTWNQAALAAEEIKRLQDRKRVFERSYERLESCAKLAMEITSVSVEIDPSSREPRFRL